MSEQFESLIHETVSDITRDEIQQFTDGLEERLATAMTKALDTVTEEFRGRLRQLEEDQARILRHLGLEDQND